MTDPAHPLFGQTFQVLSVSRGTNDSSHVFVRYRDDITLRIPRRVTSLATFVNHAERAQSWPELELTLLDLGGKPVARRGFTVAEYLPGRGSDTDLLRPRVHVPVLLEFANPGEQAVGFEIQFL